MVRKITVEKMKYKNDTLPYLLTLLGLAVNVLYFTTLYKNNHQFYYTIEMGASVLYNLLFMLAVFMCAEFIKKYNRNYAIPVFIIGIMQIVRITQYPLNALNAGAIEQGSFYLVTAYLLISGLLLIGGSVISFINSTLLKRYVEGKLVFPDEE